MKTLTAITGLAAVTSVQAAQNEPSYEDQLVAAVLVAEAGGEGYQGLRAVHETICNRAKAKGWSRQRVVLQPKQYSCLNKCDPDRLIAICKHHKAWNGALKVAMSKPGNITKGATHYDNVGRWGKPEWAKEMKEVATIKHHVFYKQEKKT